MWSKSWDIDENAPEPYPGALKRQECLYALTETPDGGLVVSGNNSRNFDDCYLVKLYGNCQNEEVVYDFETESEDGILEISEIGNTITSDETIRGSIVIHDGEKLEIYGCVVHFADTRKCGVTTNIVVEPGGDLLIHDNATLTSISDCPNSMWDGIQLIGINDIDQDQSTQPYVLVELSTIENARVGVLAGKAYYITDEHWVTPNEDRILDLQMTSLQDHGGGIVESSAPNYTNCRFGIVFDAYERRNYSWIVGSVFLNDQPIHDFDAVNAGGEGVGIGTAVKMYDVHDIIITDNTFDNQYITTEPLDRGTGVGGFDSHFWMTYNQFNNYYTGFAAGASNPLNSFVASCNTMTDVVNGMDIRGIDLAEIVKNNISLTSGHSPIGIYMEDCDAYRLEECTLTTTVVDPSTQGLVNYFSSPNDNINEIKNNVVNNFENSFVIEGYNRSTADHDLGLEIVCNEFNNYQNAIAVTLDPGIAGLQRQSGGANNMFEYYGCYSSEGELYNPSPNNPFDYYHKQDDGTNAWYVVPALGCSTAFAQVNPQSLGATQFVRSTDCPLSGYDCSSVYRRVNNSNSTNNAAIQRTRRDTTVTVLSELEINNLLRSYLHDSSIVNPIDSVISLIHASNIGKDYLLACAYQKLGREDSLQAQIQNLRTNPIYSTLTSILEIKDSLSLTRMINNAENKNYLRTMAIDSSIYGCTAARNILRCIYNDEFPQVIILPERISQKNKPNVDKAYEIKLYPNPFSDQLFVELPSMNEKYNLKIFNILGETIRLVETTGKQVYSIDTNDLESGLYLLNITVGNKVIYSGKISHIKQ